VRLFPATARRRLAVVCTAGALLVGAAATPYAQADVKHLRQQQAQAQHSIKHAQANLDESSHQTARAYAALGRSRAELRSARHDLQIARAHVRAARARLERITAQLARAKARLATAEANLARGQQAATDQRTQLVHTVTSFYEMGDPQLVGMMSLLGSTSPAELNTRDANNAFVLSSQDQALDGLKATAVLLKVQTDELTAARDQVARKTAQAAAQLAEERTFEAQAVAARDRVAASVRDRRHAWALARRAKAHDRRILARSKVRAARVHRMLMAEIAREQRKGGGYHGATGGLLMPPVNGPVTSPYGYRINPVMHYYGLHDGEDFGAACGTPIWSAGNGRILSEYYSSVWGNRLFINLGLINGKNVTVIYNHLSAYRSSVGQSVSRGQVVGLIGTTGWSTGCHTHFTVMVNGVAVNPAPWLG
jgi:murein DD-endopeptidase MepM/ murein hydrolase activator NlpD